MIARNIIDLCDILRICPVISYYSNDIRNSRSRTLREFFFDIASLRNSFIACA